MDSDSLDLELVDQNLYDCIQLEKRDIWEKMRENDCRDSFNADEKSNFFHRTCCSINKKYDKREPGILKEKFRCTEMLSLCSKKYCCNGNKSDKFKISSKGLNKPVIEDSGDGPMAKYRRMLDEAVNFTTTNR